MNQAIVSANEPISVDLKAGKSYLYCTCGRSSEQPFCDGSHEGSRFTPLSFTPESGGESALCRCKQTDHPPYCDGSHAQVSDEQVGQALSHSDSGSDSDSDAKKDSVSEQPDQAQMPEPHSTAVEPYVRFIHELAEHGLDQVGSHGPVEAMGVPRSQLPSWDHIQILVAQLARTPLQDDASVGTELVLGPQAAKPLSLRIPLFVSDMSFGALSMEAKVSLARGAEKAETGICSGEGGMLPEEQAESTRYFYEYASGRFGYRPELLEHVQAFHFK